MSNIDELNLLIHCVKDSGTHIEDTILGNSFSPLTKAFCSKWRSLGYTEEEILLYARLFENKQDIDWLNPKEWEKKKGIIR